MDDITKKVKKFKILTVSFFVMPVMLGFVIGMLYMLGQGIFNEDVIFVAVSVILITSLIFVPLAVVFLVMMTKAQNSEIAAAQAASYVPEAVHTNPMAQPIKKKNTALRVVIACVCSVAVVSLCLLGATILNYATYTPSVPNHSISDARTQQPVVIIPDAVNNANDIDIQENDEVVWLDENGDIRGGSLEDFWDEPVYNPTITQSAVLLAVPFPPSDRAPCSLCNGTRKSECMFCNGTGKPPGEAHNIDLYAEFGLGGLAAQLNELNCYYCQGTTETDCMFGYCDGTMYNPVYREYGLALKYFADETGMRIFELENNQISPYIGLDFCTMCEGLGHLPQLKTHDTHLVTCNKCLSEGMKFTFMDSFTQDELTRSYDDYLSRPAIDVSNPMPKDSIEWKFFGSNEYNSAITLGGGSGICKLYPHCRNKRHPGSEFCNSCRP